MYKPITFSPNDQIPPKLFVSINSTDIYISGTSQEGQVMQVGVVSVVCTKNVPVFITKAREKYHTKLFINVRSAVWIKDHHYGFGIPPRRSMASIQ
jgi:hypothetical protein